MLGVANSSFMHGVVTQCGEVHEGEVHEGEVHEVEVHEGGLLLVTAGTIITTKSQLLTVNQLTVKHSNKKIKYHGSIAANLFEFFVIICLIQFVFINHVPH